MRIVLIGLGQSMRGDDAVGLEAVRRWRETYRETASRPQIRVETSGLPGLNLLDLLTGFDAAVLVDAVRSNAQLGTVHRLAPCELAAFTWGAQSAHGWGVAETLALADELKLPSMPAKIRIIGIEAGEIEVGGPLSRQVQNSLPSVCEAIEQELQRLLV